MAFKTHYFSRLIILLTILFSLQSLAWREMGHKTICKIAYNHLDKRITTVINEFYPNSKFSEECLYADYVRTLVVPGNTEAERYVYYSTYNWHFIPLELDQDYMEQKQYPPTKYGDAIYGINEAYKEISKAFKSSQQISPTNIQEKSEAYDRIRFHLRMLLHLVADLHQPLHAGSHDHRGGNRTEAFIKLPGMEMETFDYKRYILKIPGAETQVRGLSLKEEPRFKVEAQLYGGDTTLLIYSKSKDPQPINLHMVWDEHLLEYFCHNKLGSPDCNATLKEEASQAYAQYLENYYGNPSEKQMQPYYKGWSYNWYLESIALLEQVEQAHGKGPVAVDSEYYKMAMPIIHNRTYVAGRRIAKMLNALFLNDDPEYLNQFRSELYALENIESRNLEQQKIKHQTIQQGIKNSPLVSQD